jgi:hypothetical protein
LREALVADLLLDAIDAIGDGRHFVEAVLLASAAACPQPAHRNAISAACDAAEKKLKQAQEMLKQHRGDSSAFPTRATKPAMSDRAKIHSAKLTLASVRALAHPLTLMAPKVAAESTDDEKWRAMLR